MNRYNGTYFAAPQAHCLHATESSLMKQLLRFQHTLILLTTVILLGQTACSNTDEEFPTNDDKTTRDTASQEHDGSSTSGDSDDVETASTGGDSSGADSGASTDTTVIIDTTSGNDTTSSHDTGLAADTHSGEDTHPEGDSNTTADTDAGTDTNAVVDTGINDTSTLPDSYQIDTSVTPPPQASGYLHVDGNRLVDDSDNPARLTGVNWFGFETSNLSPHGLWARDYRSMMHQIADLGFNTVRIPWCNAMLRDGAATSSINTYGADPYDGNDPMNEGLDAMTPIEVMDVIIDAASEYGLKVLLDNHSRNPDGYMEEDLWYTESTSENQWVEDWVFMADRYKGNTTVIAFDLNNEPHDDASWGTGNAATDWNDAATRCGTAIQQVNPDALIVVEGVEDVGDSGYWWGGNLMGVANHPIQLPIQNKLVYSAHEYGPEVFAQPWFESSEFPENMSDIWDAHFGFIPNTELGHVFIGEFGINDPESMNGVAGIWFNTFLSYMSNSDGYSWTFWSMNPNSGDTGGILDYDWVTPHDWKMEALKTHLAPMIK